MKNRLTTTMQYCAVGILSLISSVQGYSQYRPDKVPRSVRNADPQLYISKQNIFRFTITQPNFGNSETDFLTAGSWERYLAKNITSVAKLGFGFDHRKFGPVEDPDQSSYHLYTSVEIKHYVSVERRKRKFRPTLNHSGPYASLEFSFISNPFLLINMAQSSAVKSSSTLYLNYGYQRQYGKFYFNLYAGIPLWRETEQNFSDFTRAVHTGLGVGYVF